MTQELPAAEPNEPDPIIKLIRLIEGWRDGEGNLRKGVIDRLEVIEEREAAREKARIEYEAQRRVVLVGIGLTFIGTLITQITAWFNTHFK